MTEASTNSYSKQSVSTRRQSASIFIATCVSSLVSVMLAISYASVVFSGPLSKFAPIGISLTLIAAAILGVVIAIRSSHRGTVAGVAAETAVLGLVTSAIGAQANVLSEASLLVTTVVAIGLTGCMTGLTFWFSSRSRIVELIRFIPHPVIGGFVAGIGWLLIVGAWAVCLDTSPASVSPSALLEPNAAQRWIPALVTGLVLYLAQRHYKHYLVLPLVLGGALCVFLVTALVNQTSLETLINNGWMLGPYPIRLDGLVSTLVEGSNEVQWSLIINELPTMMTFVIIMWLGILLSTTSLETTLRTDLNLNRELRAAGAANFLGGACGGLTGYHFIGCTTLTHNLGAHSRWVGVLTGGACVLALLAGTDILGLLPRFLAGALLFWMGIDFVVTWLVDSYRRLSKSDYSLVLAVYTVVVGLGFMPGVGFGLVAGLGLFALNYSRINVIRSSFTGAHMHSRVYRQESELQGLREHGEEIRILSVDGFLFFGTVIRLVQTIRAMPADASAAPLNTLILDLRGVKGLDSSASLHFARLARLAREQHFTLVLCGIRPSLRRQLAREGCTFERRINKQLPYPDERRRFTDLSVDAERIRLFSDIDRALEWAEDQLITRYNIKAAPPNAALETYLSEHLGGSEGARQFLRYAKLRTFDQDELLIQQTDQSDEVFFILAGEVSVVVDLEAGQRLRLRRLGPGSPLGEVAMYLNQPRTASVIAECTTTVFAFDRESLANMREERPDLHARYHEMMATMLAARLAENSRLLDAVLR